MGAVINLVHGLKAIPLLTVSRGHAALKEQPKILTAVSTPHSNACKNFEPIRAHTLSSSTSNIRGLVIPHTDSTEPFFRLLVELPSGNISGIDSPGSIPFVGNA
jgi:hypothetical protein